MMKKSAKFVWGRLSWSLNELPFFKWVMLAGVVIVAVVVTLGMASDGHPAREIIFWDVIGSLFWISFLAFILTLACPSKAARAPFIARPYFWQFGLTQETAIKVDMLIKAETAEEKFEIASMIVTSLDPDKLEDRNWYRYAAAMREYRDAVERWAES